MAKQLYDYWFVQFDFPNEEGKPYKSSGGKMVWNETLKRDIPAGWSITSVGDIIKKLSSGKRPSGGIDKSLKTGIPSLGAECIDRLGVYDFSSTPYIPFDYREKIKSGIIENNDILVYKDGAYVGKTTLFKNGFPYEFATINEHVFLVHAKKEVCQEYLLFTLLQDTYFNIMQSLGKAKAAQPGLNQDDLSGICLLLPPDHLLESFHKCVSKQLDLLFTQAKQIGALLEQRNSLLPLLMNGQVTIKQ